MKILKLRFKNLNSLAGEWTIDFTAPEYTADGIFAISGPTGAGKSTIMDAICLALYGRTPRLDNISASTNEIMTRNTGECFAEVVFGTDQGKFRAHWGQHRSRKKPDGALQAQKHELAEADSGNVLASQISETKELIIEKTGMDFRRFTQSMMLAQGGFAVFLQATANERAPILEQITGTEIYSDISRYVFARQKEENQALENLQRDLGNVAVMDDETEQLVRSELRDKNKLKGELSASLDNLRKAEAWLDGLTLIKKALETLAEEERTLAQEIMEFEPEKEALGLALKALALDADHAALASLRRLQDEDLKKVKELHEEIPGLTEKVEQCQVTFNEKERLLQAAVHEREQLLQLTAIVRPLDERIVNQKEALTKLDERIRLLTEETAEEEGRKESAQKLLDEYSVKLDQIQTWLDEHKADVELVENLAGIIAGLNSMEQSWLMVESSASSLQELRESLNGFQEKIKEIQEEIKKAANIHSADAVAVATKRQEIADLLNGRTIVEILRAKDELVLRIAELNKISRLDEERNKLADDQPCPLCGSRHHPWAEGNVPRKETEEISLELLQKQIDQHGELNTALNNLLKKESESANKLTALMHDEELIRQNEQNTIRQISEAKKELENRQAGFERLRQQLGELLTPFGVNEIQANKEAITALNVSLTERKNTWVENIEAKKNAEGQVQLERNKIAQFNTVIELKKKDLSERIMEKEKAGKTLKDSQEERDRLFGDKPVSEEEQISAEKVEECRISREESLMVLNDNKQLLETRVALLKNLKESSTERQNQLGLSEENFRDRFIAADFKDEQAYLDCRIPEERRNQLEQRSGILSTKKTQIETQKTLQINKLEEERAKNLTSDDQETLQLRRKEQQESFGRINDEAAVLAGKLNQNQAAREKGARIMEQIISQKKVFERWDKLNRLIGSADGKKFRNFAQGLTLEIMISHANRQLVKLSDRYLLSRDEDEPLELRVIDHYQAGQVRSTKNLSGGESFIVSLALALGLSGMSSRNVRVDSLFLDEGFGTLDEEALETALVTLASLRQEGKMIGLISHVGALKDRIGTKITVEPIREGRSRLSGPGCRCEMENW